MVESHIRTDDAGRLRAGVLFACLPMPVVLGSWLLLVLAVASWNFALAEFAMLAGFTASLLAPAGLVLAIRGYRSSQMQTAVDRRKAMFALIGNTLVLAHVLVILAVVAHQR